MVFDTKDDGCVLGVPPTNARAKRVVVCTTEGDDGFVAWSVPKSGGTPTELASYDYTAEPVLHDRAVYHLDNGEPMTGAISRVSENGGDVETVVTSPNPINAFTFDDCGIVTLEPVGDEMNATTNVVRTPLP